MASIEEIRKERLKKIDILREAGIEAYPAKSDVEMTLGEVLVEFEKLEENKKEVKIGGRIMALRVQGGLAFFDLNDGTGNLQALLKKDDLGEKFDLFVETIDVGDFVQVEGVVFITKRGEKTIQGTSWKILTKSLRPLPEKWAGLQDEEERFRKRYLDILTNPEVRAMVEKRSIFWQTIRNFLLNRGFLEVDTPILENTPGGAEAKPFMTHHNALDTEVSLRIATELWLKRLMVAGLPKVFEIGRVFRNEGMDAEHLQDFSMLEFYWAYADYEQGMKFVEELYKDIAEKTFGTLKFKIKNFEIDLDQTWEKYDYVGTILEKTGIDIGKADLAEIESKLKELGVQYDKKGFNLNRAIDNLWKYCRKQIAGPGFLVNVPVMMEPLAKRSAENKNLVERFQVILAGSEMGKGFSELNDPVDQLNRFGDQMKLREAGDEEAQIKDDDFVEALEYGMPPTCGFGMSERLFSFLMDKPIREAQIFPLMRPKDVKEIKAKDLANYTAVAVINKADKLEKWQELNTIAHLNASFAIRYGRSLLYQDKIKTKDDKEIYLNIQNAILIKEAKDNEEIIDLLKKAEDNEIETFEFIRPMIETSDDKKIIDYAKNHDLGEIDFLGVLIFGKRSVVEKITASFPLIK
ncbi:MAG: lysine--tRNA ligase [Candidatus Vogelbacteria bacterium]|nr:lysine--tRNA ligase [Candidatus Vogelbacteria bacterium]